MTQEEFEEAYERAKAEVASWPEWKRKMIDRDIIEASNRPGCPARNEINDTGCGSF